MFGGVCVWGCLSVLLLASVTQQASLNSVDGLDKREHDWEQDDVVDLEDNRELDDELDDDLVDLLEKRGQDWEKDDNVVDVQDKRAQDEHVEVPFEQDILKEELNDVHDRREMDEDQDDEFFDQQKISNDDQGIVSVQDEREVDVNNDDDVDDQDKRDANKSPLPWNPSVWERDEQDINHKRGLELAAWLDKRDAEAELYPDDGLLSGATYDHEGERGTDDHWHRGDRRRRTLPLVDDPNASVRVGQGTRTDPESRVRRSGGVALAVTAAVIAGLAALLIIGPSIARAIFGDDERCEIRIETKNYIWWPLSNPRTHNKGGHIKHPAKIVSAGTKEAMLATSRGGIRKQSSYGTVSWEINAPQLKYRKRVIVMWYAPYFFLWGHKANKLAVGIIESHQDSRAMYKHMFKYDGSWDKREYKENAEYIKYCDDTFCIRGTMGTHHSSQVVIDVFPRDASCLADNLAGQYKNMMNFKPKRN